MVTMWSTSLLSVNGEWVVLKDLCNIGTLKQRPESRHGLSLCYLTYGGQWAFWWAPDAPHVRCIGASKNHPDARGHARGHANVLAYLYGNHDGHVTISSGQNTSTGNGGLEMHASRVSASGFFFSSSINYYYNWTTSTHDYNCTPPALDDEPCR